MEEIFRDGFNYLTKGFRIPWVGILVRFSKRNDEIDMADGFGEE